MTSRNIARPGGRAIAARVSSWRRILWARSVRAWRWYWPGWEAACLSLAAPAYVHLPQADAQATTSEVPMPPVLPEP